MGLIKAAVGAAGGALADSWREFFYCDALDQSTLAVKGSKRTSSKGRSSNTKAEDNIITNGSVIAVADGQCMIIVEQGEVVDMCAEPGEFTYDTSTEPSLFYGNLGENIMTCPTMARNATKRTVASSAVTTLQKSTGRWLTMSLKFRSGYTVRQNISGTTAISTVRYARLRTSAS